ncbi:hypothetical protein GGF31_003598 [Allomyces arbusculus]|nr:hypothetical protein GGF31_003598 [Allomyces arbusculus]
MRVAAMVRLLAAGRAALAPPGVPSVPGGPTESVTLVGSGPVALAIAKSLATNPPTGAKAVALTSRLPLTQPPAQSLPPSPRLAVTHTCDVAAAVQRAGTVVVCVPPAHTRHVAQVHVHPHDPGSVVLVVAAGLASLVVRRWFVAGSDAAPVASRVVHVALDPKEVEGGERPWNAAQVVPLIRKTMAHFGIQVLTSTPVNDYPSWVAFIGTIDFLAQLTRCVSSTNHE